MIQRINLYTEELRGRHIRFPASQLLSVLGVAAVLMLAVYGVFAGQLAAVRAERGELGPRVQAMRQDLTRLADEAANRRASPALERRLHALRTELERKRRLIGALDGTDIGNPVGFSAYLEGLGRRRIEGLWLNEIVVADGGAQLALRGSTVAETLVPAYLHALSTEGAFEGREFTTFWMRRPEDGARRIDFALATQCQRRDGQALATSVCRPKGEGR